jgi:hypothetical protein
MNKQERNQYNKIWREKNRDKILLMRRKTRDKLRADVLTSYGNKCNCCGEQEYKFLGMDHRTGNGNKHRHEIGKHSSQAFYSWLRKNKYPKDFQILCHNCNLSKGFYGKCPHEN